MGIDNTFKAIIPKQTYDVKSVSIQPKSWAGAGRHGMYLSILHCSAILWCCFYKAEVQGELSVEYAL